MKTQNKTTSKKILTALFALLFNCMLNAQDLITFKNGDELTVNIVEISETEIRYKKLNDAVGGPLIIIYKSDVFSVKYANGSKEIFNVSSQQNPVNPVYVNPSQNQVINNGDFDKDSTDFAKRRRKRFGGPRVGATYLGPGVAADFIESQGKVPVFTQFGWQFEGRLFTSDNGIQGLLEFVPLIGGLEQGIFIPSASALLGLRFGEKRIYEFGIGPNFTMTRDYKRNPVGKFGVVIAFGTSFKSGNIYFPVNLAFVPGVGDLVDGDFYDNKTGDLLYSDGTKVRSGWKLSLLVGFNYRKK